MNADLLGSVMLTAQIVQDAQRLGGEPYGRTALNEVRREQIQEVEIVRPDHLLPNSRKHHGIVEERIGTGAPAGKLDHFDIRSDLEFVHQLAPEERRVERDVQLLPATGACIRADKLPSPRNDGAAG